MDRGTSPLPFRPARDDGRHHRPHTVTPVLAGRVVVFEQGGRERVRYGEELLNHLAADLTSRYAGRKPDRRASRVANVRLFGRGLSTAPLL